MDMLMEYFGGILFIPAAVTMIMFFAKLLEIVTGGV